MTDLEKEKKKLCARERQDFIDCMFIHNECFQSGRLPFDQCLKEYPDSIPNECIKLWKAIGQCRKQMVYH